MSVSLRAPGPQGSWLLGNLTAFERDPLHFVTHNAREHGDIYAARLFNIPAFFLNHPDYIEYVLVTNQRKFIKPMAFRMPFLTRLVGRGLFTSEGDFWLRQRRLVQPAFHRERIKTYGDIGVGYAGRMLESWRDGETLDVHQEMMRLLMPIVARSLFDADVTGDAKEIGQALTVVGEPFLSQFTQIMEWMLLIGIRAVEPHVSERTRQWMLNTRFPTPSNRRFYQSAEQLDKIIFRIIQEHRESNRDRGDLISMLLQVQDEDGSRMTDKQLRDEVITLFLAGHETTAISMTWAWYLLAQHPEVEAKLHAELSDVLDGRAPTAADIPRLQYTEMIVKEAMRLYPPLWGQAREAREECEIGGYRIPAGSQVFMCQWVLHRDPRYFQQPDEFIPERWAGDAWKSLPRFAYFPFGGGPRLCIGNSFAMMQTMLLMATIAQRFRLKLAPGHAVTLLPTITLRPRDGVKVVLEARGQAHRATSSASA